MTAWLSEAGDIRGKHEFSGIYGALLGSLTLDDSGAALLILLILKVGSELFDAALLMPGETS